MNSCSRWMNFMHFNSIEIIPWSLFQLFLLEKLKQSKREMFTFHKERSELPDEEIWRTWFQWFYERHWCSILSVHIGKGLARSCWMNLLLMIWILLEESGKFLKSFHYWKELQLNEGVSCLRIRERVRKQQYWLIISFCLVVTSRCQCRSQRVWYNHDK